MKDIVKKKADTGLNDNSVATILYRNQSLQIKRGTTVSELMNKYPHSDDDKTVAAIINNMTVSLNASIVRSGTIEPVLIKSQKGARLYQRHLTIMLYKVFYTLFPDGNIRIGQSIAKGHYFTVKGVTVNDKFMESIDFELKRLSRQKVPFKFISIPVEEARRLFFKKGRKDKKKLLDQWHSSHVPLIKLDDFIDFCLTPVAPDTGYFNEFNLLKIEDSAFVLQFPDYRDSNTKTPVKYDKSFQPKLYQTHKQARWFSDLSGVGHVADLNAAAISKRIKNVIKVAEALHEKNLSNIADEIAKEPVRRLVFIAGPSSSGKTTFSKRLSVQLKVLGFEPISLSLDNYYVDREKTPKGPDGKKDFELLEAIDLKQFNIDLRKILDGQEVLTPLYNFSTGLRDKKDKWLPVKLGSNGIIIIEGIHGLNDLLTPAIKSKEKYKIYINALNPLAIDNHNRLNTSDVRLIRRIVRDRHYRGYSAAQTINNWSSVRRGERNHIFPFQESADIIFDTSLIYEFSVLKIWAEYYLMEVPRSDPAFAEAYRLRQFLSMFVTLLPADVPNTSLMREFIGGSGFSYR